MTSGIRPYSTNQSSTELASSAGATAPAQAKVSGEAAAQATPVNEAVTLTQNAQTSARLLASARQAPGVDSEAMARLSSAVQNNSFNVQPDTLAGSIISATHQIRP
jgi:hypothetical protein